MRSAACLVCPASPPAGVSFPCVPLPVLCVLPRHQLVFLACVGGAMVCIGCAAHALRWAVRRRWRVTPPCDATLRAPLLPTGRSSTEIRTLFSLSVNAQAVSCGSAAGVCVSDDGLVGAESAPACHGGLGSGGDSVLVQAAAVDSAQLMTLRARVIAAG